MALYDFNGENDGDLKLWWERGFKFVFFVTKSQLSYNNGWSHKGHFCYSAIRKLFLDIFHLTFLPLTTAEMDEIFVKRLYRVAFNRPFPSRLLPLCQNESLCKTTHMKMFFLYRWLDVKVYMTDFFFICSIKSPQCTDMYSKEKFSIAIFFSRVLMYQKRQISLPVGYKTARPKTGDWERLWRQFGTLSLAKNRFLSHFLIVS